MTLLLSLSLLIPVSGATQDRFDILIRDGRVIDGTGTPWYNADVGIIGDRIVRVGDLSDATANQVINARGLTVSPGFIDPHTHAMRGI
ncbi:MAG TPA: aminoacylase, partial [Gammaproteobacteria bacterium]|nr:aminoacylase [Gammaproteobacteria bacterium]